MPRIYMYTDEDLDLAAERGVFTQKNKSNKAQ
jgi:hypothetical protein